MSLAWLYESKATRRRMPLSSPAGDQTHDKSQIPKDVPSTKLAGSLALTWGGADFSCVPPSNSHECHYLKIA